MRHRCSHRHWRRHRRRPAQTDTRTHRHNDTGTQSLCVCVAACLSNPGAWGARKARAVPGRKPSRAAPKASAPQAPGKCGTALGLWAPQPSYGGLAPSGAAVAPRLLWCAGLCEQHRAPPSYHRQVGYVVYLSASQSVVARADLKWWSAHRPCRAGGGTLSPQTLPSAWWI
eukprot:gene9909-biopygen18252